MFVMCLRCCGVMDRDISEPLESYTEEVERLTAEDGGRCRRLTALGKDTLTVGELIFFTFLGMSCSAATDALFLSTHCSFSWDST